LGELELCLSEFRISCSVQWYLG